MPSPENRVVVAAAGSGKTQSVIDGCLAEKHKRILVTTFTNSNLDQIRNRLEGARGVIPPNVHLASWFSFLLRDGVRPYQRSVLGAPGVVGGLNFVGRRPERVPRSTPRAFYLDRHGDAYRDGVSDFACAAHEKSGGLVISRLEQLYDEIYVDEMQDMVGHDLEFLDLLLRSRIKVTLVGDPRQFTLRTNLSPKNKKYQGTKILDWFAERKKICVREELAVSHRCHQEICDFASDLFPAFERIVSQHNQVTGHDGIHRIPPAEVHEYVEKYAPIVLRHDARADTLGHPALNIGLSKGHTYDRVLIFPTGPMRHYLNDGDASKLKAPESLYVAVTRARHSVAFVQ